jgi:hypothetical protein
MTQGMGHRLSGSIEHLQIAHIVLLQLFVDSQGEDDTVQAAFISHRQTAAVGKVVSARTICPGISG